MPIRKNYKPGEVIIRENTLGNSAYIIKKGKVEVSKNIGKQRIVFTSLGDGSIFGEMSLVDNSPRSATVTALTETTVTVLSKTNFQAMLRQQKPLQSIFGVLADRLRETDKQVNPLKLTNFYFSLCSLIYHLARSSGHGNDYAMTIDLGVLLDECSMILAIDKELVAKVVNRMVFTKLVKMEKEKMDGVEQRVLVITDAGKFREWIEFLRAQSSVGDQDEAGESPERSEETYQLLKVLCENNAEFDPSKGKNSVSYDNYIQQVSTLLNFDHEEADKLLRSYLDTGLFRITVDTQQNVRKLVCNDPDRLENELKKLENMRSYLKMAELLKAMASN